MDLKRRIPSLAFAGSMVAAGLLVGTGGVVSAADAPVYRVTVANLGPGQPLTPPVVVLHDAKTSIVEAGAAASDGIGQLAENGNAQVLLDALATDPHVGGVAVGEHPIVSGGIPGAAELPSFATIEVTGDKSSRLISVASMLVCTNDGLSIVHDQKLPRQVGQTVVLAAQAYDAGTETNTEDFADMVPPCQPLVGVMTDDEGVGASDPALAEGGVIAPHPGIAGSADLDPAAHAIAETPALVVVERIA